MDQEETLEDFEVWRARLLAEIEIGLSVLSNTDPPKCTHQDMGNFFGYEDKPQDPYTAHDFMRSRRVCTYRVLTDHCRDAYEVDTIADARSGGPLGWGIAQQLALLGPQIVAGVDTLTLTVTGQLTDQALANLETFRADAEQGQTVTIASGPFLFVMQPYGVKPHWRYVLEDPGLALKIRKTNAYTTVIQADVRASMLWSLGVDMCADLVEQLAARLAGPKVRLDVSRIDLCADFAGDMFEGNELVTGQFVTRARKRQTYRTAEGEPAQKVTADQVDYLRNMADSLQPGGSLKDLKRAILRNLGSSCYAIGENIQEHTRSTEYRQGRTFTGYSFGAGAMVARIYRKDLQLRTAKCEWFRDIWKENGHDEGPVWRVEFQIRTDALKTFVSDGVESREWSRVRNRIGGIWNELTGRKRGKRGYVRGWLTLRTKTKDKQATRWPIDPRWSEIMRVEWPTDAHVLRVSEKIKSDIVQAAGGGAHLVQTEKVKDNPNRTGRVNLENLTGKAAMDRLGPQLVGLAAAFVAARSVATGRDARHTEQDAQRYLTEAVQVAMNTCADREWSQVLRQKEDALAQRAAWRVVSSE